MSRHLFLVTLAIIVKHTLFAQSKMLLENYYYKKEDYSTIMPVFHFQTNNNWYAELRYNYEEVRTTSFYAGKTITGGDALGYSITPLIGYAVGQFRGLSFAVNAEAEWKSLFMSSQSQYSVSNRTCAESFFFTWSEAGYSLSDYFFTGLALQYTRLSNESYLEPGFFAGLDFKNFSFPCYVFDPFQQPYFVIGLNYEINFKKKKD